MLLLSVTTPLINKVPKNQLSPPFLEKYKSRIKKPMEDDWKTVSFAKTKRKLTRSSTTPTHIQNVPGINVKIYDADIGKYLNTQKLNYVEKTTGFNTEKIKRKSNLQMS